MAQQLNTNTVRAAQRGDGPARSQVAASCREMFRRALGKRGILDDAREEIIQEALIVVLRQLGGFEWRAKFETWALAILFRVQRRYQEQEITRGRRAALESDLATDDDPDAMERVSDPGDDPLVESIKAQLRDALSDCLKPVPIDMREVWVRHRFHGHKHEEIAAALELSINTVGTRIYRADRKLRDCLEKKGFTADTVASGR